MPFLTDCGFLRPFGAVLGAALGAIGHSRRIHNASDDVIPNARKILYPAASDQNDRVFLQIVPFPGNIRGYFHLIGQPNTGYLSQSRIRLFGS